MSGGTPLLLATLPTAWAGRSWFEARDAAAMRAKGPDPHYCHDGYQQRTTNTVERNSYTNLVFRTPMIEDMIAGGVAVGLAVEADF